jgi:hypothetical protein
MAKQKSEVFSISLQEKHKEMAKIQSASIFGRENISGYFAYLLERENKVLENGN